jgi:hypothetical protein
MTPIAAHARISNPFERLSEIAFVQSHGSQGGGVGQFVTRHSDACKNLNCLVPVATTVMFHAAALGIMLNPVLRLTGQLETRFLFVTWLVARITWWLIAIHLVEIALVLHGHCAVTRMRLPLLQTRLSRTYRTLSCFLRESRVRGRVRGTILRGVRSRQAGRRRFPECADR